MKREHAAAHIYTALTMAGPQGLSRRELLDETGLTDGAFGSGLEMLKDSLRLRGVPLNVEHRQPYRYSIPLAVDGDVTLDHNGYRHAIIAQTMLRRLMIHARAAQMHHPQQHAEFDELARMSNTCIKRIDKTLHKLGLL